MKKYENEEQWFLELRTGWLIRITKRAFLRWLRDNYPESRYKIQVTSIDHLVPQLVNVSSGNPGSLAVIRDCMEQLKEEQKVVIELCCIRGLSRLDAAMRLNKPVGTVKSLIHRGKEALKRCLEGKKVSR
jgi:DNA-directed RNA polymerase specialized sigma24 family protein